MSRLVSRAELASLAGVSKAAITKACKGTLAAACEGSRVDIDHDAVVAYLAKRGVKLPDAPAPKQTDGAPTTQRKATKAARRAPTRPAAPTVAADAPTDGAPTGTEEAGPVRIVSREVKDVSAIADMSIREVVAAYGTVTAFKDWLLGLKLIAEVHEKNLKNAKEDGKLISRELVQSRIMGAIEQVYRRLLTDAAKTIARELYAAARSNVALEDAEQLVRRIVADQLRPAKEAASRALRPE